MTNRERKAKSKAKKSKFGTTLKLTALLVLGWLVGWGSGPLLGLFGVGFSEASVSPWVLIPSLLLSLIFVLAFHEAGHMVSGKLVGFRFMLFIVGPFKLYSTESGVRLGLNRSLAVAGGLGGAVPTDSRNLTRRMAVYVAGGPTSSLLLAATTLGLLFITPLSIGTVLSTVTVASFFIGVVTLIPSRIGGLVGLNLKPRRLMRNSDRDLSSAPYRKISILPSTW